MDDLDTSDDDSDDDLSLEAVSVDGDDDDESAEVFVDARTHAVSNRPSSSSSRPSSGVSSRAPRGGMAGDVAPTQPSQSTLTHGTGERWPWRTAKASTKCIAAA